MAERRLSATVTPQALAELLSEVSDGSVQLTDGGCDTPLRSLGLPSMTLVAFFAAIEERFGIEWSEETPSEAFTSLVSLAEHLRSDEVQG